MTEAGRLGEDQRPEAARSSSSAASTCTGIVLVAVPPLPSLTVSFTLRVPAVVNVVFAEAVVASVVPSPS